MAEDPNETARRAFGEGPAMPPAPPAAPAPVAEPQRQARPAGPVPGQQAGALAAWGTRAAAFVLDALFLAGMTFALLLVIAAAAGTDDRRTLETVAYAVGIPLGFLYAPLLMMRRGKANGQTFGKQMMDIRVVRTGGEPVTFWNAFLRQVFGQQLLIGLTFYVYAFVDYLWPLRDARNQALHDKIASTLVIRTKDGGLPQPPAAVRPAGAADAPAPPPPPSPRRVDEGPAGNWLPPSAGG